jgi:hypothetical protein
MGIEEQKSSTFLSSMLTDSIARYVRPPLQGDVAAFEDWLVVAIKIWSLWGDGVVTLGRRSGHFGETEWSLWGDEFEKNSSLSIEK